MYRGHRHEVLFIIPVHCILVRHAEVPHLGWCSPADTEQGTGAGLLSLHLHPIQTHKRMRGKTYRAACMQHCVHTTQSACVLHASTHTCAGSVLRRAGGILIILLETVV